MPAHAVDVDIINRLGLHARASAKLVETASQFSSAIRIGRGERLVDARSIMSLLMLGAGHGSCLRLHIEGDDADAALAAVTALIADRFGESE
ncbi:phosphocarrier protein NPr/phosphocarrier protein [Paraperlucidibaca baekdonensis]|uniref:Phosphocarrier protein NPr/phosphocarrier protein n=1 Tax=Paraperlucidibaca baekdonensis TaxID=748120 RepID=A0A3E0H5N0_9GAMM|nr:HPr family phosphocarrier protein [Paraperlucidibaca baekdonensis]REH38715.1 phosphocarrier protein NPr/phosphocarrier protein [Paraperlucidibaca baekdonensis]